MIRRRAFAFLALYGAAIGSALYWNDGAIEWMTFTANLGAATIGFVWLHFRWREQEAKIMTPKSFKDIFS